MKKLILVTGTVQTALSMPHYKCDIWAEREGKNLQYITSTDQAFSGYDSFMDYCIGYVATYFNDEKFKDGAYTIYMEQLIPIY